jgi:putative ABC transport system substrate-binding protein
MRRRDFVLAGAATLILPSLALAQKKTPVIGLVWNDSVKPSPYVATFLGALGEKGYAAGRDFRLEDRVTLEGYGRNVDEAAELVRAKVDLIVAYGTTATFAAAKATKDIPIVTIIGSDPVASGLAASLARPGGNVTGVVTFAGRVLTAKRYELLKELVPGLSRVGTVISGSAANPESIREGESAARKLNLQLHYREASGPGDVDAQIGELVKSGVGAINVGASTMLASHSGVVVAAIAKHRIPAVYGVERYADAGGLLVYSPSVRKAFVRIAGYADRILKGARPGELPIEQTTDLELVVNLKTARALGIKVPQSILVRADRVIE